MELVFFCETTLIFILSRCLFSFAFYVVLLSTLSVIVLSFNGQGQLFHLSCARVRDYHLGVAQIVCFDSKLK